MNETPFQRVMRLRAELDAAEAALDAELGGFERESQRPRLVVLEGGSSEDAAA